MNQQIPEQLPPTGDELEQVGEPANLVERLEAAEARAQAAEEAAVAAQTAANEATGTAPRYAVYDTVYEKYAPGVFDKKPTSAAAKKLVGHDDFEIREV